MPTPEQARYTPGTKDAMSDPKFVALERALNRLPVFPEYERRLQNPAADTTLSNTNAIDMNLTTDGLFYVDFEKFETWTDIKIRFTMSGVTINANRAVTISGVITDQAGVSVTVDPIARFYLNVVEDHHTFYGDRRVSGLNPGVYRLQFQWRVSGNSFRVDAQDTIYASVVECIPIPTL